MPSMITIVVGIVGIILGVIAGLAYSRQSSSGRISKANHDAERILGEAGKEAEVLKKEALLEAKEQIIEQKKEAEKDERERKAEIRSMENRVLQREESLDKREESLDKRTSSLDNREQQLTSLNDQLESKNRELDDGLNKQTKELERISTMTRQEAREELLDTLRQDVIADSAAIIRDAEQRVKMEADKKARSIISMSIQRLASDQTSEITVTSVPIPSDDLKGRIIGREGRNIRTFEQMTGVNLIIDDTPETVVLSSFDPVRRETARIALENLITDGRIHPARIEEMYNKASVIVQERVKEAGEQAAFDAGIHDLDEEIINTLGRLRYRTSYGQNVLNHSLEVSNLAGMMASELGLDPAPAKRAGLLHDLGKAVDHEIEGPHAVIGADICRRHGEAPHIVHAIEAHHFDVEPSSVLDFLVQAADAISASRPGARRESAESYIKRLEKLEEISNSYNGVERTYAMQAGREIRVMVKPEQISDAESTVLAHDISRRIEDEMEYPGQVKVVVIRESRSVDYAK